jgi:hypothetical protein
MREKEENTNKIFIGRPLGTVKYGLENNIKTELKEKE